MINLNLLINFDYNQLNRLLLFYCKVKIAVLKIFKNQSMKHVSKEQSNNRIKRIFSDTILLLYPCIILTLFHSCTFTIKK